MRCDAFFTDHVTLAGNCSGSNPSTWMSLVVRATMQYMDLSFKGIHRKIIHKGTRPIWTALRKHDMSELISYTKGNKQGSSGNTKTSGKNDTDDKNLIVYTWFKSKNFVFWIFWRLFLFHFWRMVLRDTSWFSVPTDWFDEWYTCYLAAGGIENILLSQCLNSLTLS